MTIVPAIASKSRPRAALLASFPESIPTFRGPLIRELDARGWAVHVLCPGLTTGSQHRAAVEALGATAHEVELQRTGTNPLSDLFYFMAVRKRLAQLQPDVVLSYTIKPMVYGTLAAWCVGVPRRGAMVTGLGYVFTGGRRGLLARVVEKLCRTALSRASVVFFQNPDDRELLLQRGALPAAVPVQMINGSGVDLDYYAMSPMPKGEVVFLFIARLLGAKGVREFVEAARRLRFAGSSARFRIAGWIDENPDAIAASELEEWRQEGVVEYLGRLSDVRPALRSCTVFVLPSYREGTPRTVLEALATGRPVITSDAPGCRETITDGVEGFLVPPADALALEAAMTRFLDLAETERDAMALAAVQRARSKYDVRTVNEAIIGALID